MTRDCARWRLHAYAAAFFAGVAVTFALVLLTAIVLYEVSRIPKDAIAVGRPIFERTYFILDRRLGWRLAPNLRVQAAGPAANGTLLFQTDRYGFRNRVSDPPGRSTLVLGDSFVQGYYLAENETIPAQLQDRLGITVINLGVGGYSTDQEFLVARQALEHFDAERLVMVFFINDLPLLDQNAAWGMSKPRFQVRDGQIDFDELPTSASGPDRGAAFSASFGTQPVVSTIRGEYADNRWSLFVNLFYAKLHGVKAAALAPWRTAAAWIRTRDESSPAGELELAGYKGGPDAVASYRDAAFLGDEWNLAFQLFSKTREMAAERGVEFIVYFLPEAAQILDGRPEFFRPQEEFVKRCLEHRIDCIEPHREYLAAVRAKRALYFVDDGHLSPAGAAFTAEILYRHMTPH